MNKSKDWRKVLPLQTRVLYIDKEPVWHDRHIVYSCLMGFVSGVIIGVASCI